MIVAYVSGHGYGHATRVAEVLRAVRAREPDAKLGVVTAAPEKLFRDAVAGPLVFRSRECDVGLVQKGPLVIDEDGTARRWREFAAGSAARVEDEARWLGQVGARLVLGDVPPLAFEAAAKAGIPAVALTNFSWDWVYRHLARRQPWLREAAEAAAAAYGNAALLLQLPFAGDLSAFPRREPIPMVARRPRLSRADARARLGLPPGRAVVLVSFGGIGTPAIDLGALAALGDLQFLIDAAEGPRPSNVLALDAARRDALGLRYHDLVGAADVVVTKPGYGIVTDAIAAGTRIVYTERGDFPEYPILVAEMPRYVPCAHLGNDDLLAGRWGPAIESVLARPLPPPPDLGGAGAAAARLLALAGS